MSSTDNVSNEARGVKGSRQVGDLAALDRRDGQAAEGETSPSPVSAGDRLVDAYALRMLVPWALPLALGVAGWFAGRWAGAITAFGVGLLIDVAVMAGAALWARQIGSLLEPEDALTVAPRPPGYRRLVEWVYERTL